MVDPNWRKRTRRWVGFAYRMENLTKVWPDQARAVFRRNPTASDLLARVVVYRANLKRLRSWPDNRLN